MRLRLSGGIPWVASTAGRTSYSIPIKADSRCPDDTTGTKERQEGRTRGDGKRSSERAEKDKERKKEDEEKEGAREDEEETEKDEESYCYYYCSKSMDLFKGKLSRNHVNIKRGIVDAFSTPLSCKNQHKDQARTLGSGSLDVGLGPETRDSSARSFRVSA